MSSSYEDIDDSKDNDNDGIAMPIVSDAVSSFYDQAYKEELEQQSLPSSSSSTGNKDGAALDRTNANRSNNTDDHHHHHDNDAFDDDDQIETVMLSYDMGISQETKLCSRWIRRCFNCFSCCKRPHEIDGLEDKPSNEELLSIAFISFLSFTICQGTAGYLAKSQAMMGDSIAMAVDAFTYGFNLVAERMKNKADYSVDDLDNGNDDPDEFDINININTSPEDVERRTARAKRKLKLTLELVPPLISVTTLAIVTGFILHESIGVLVLDTHRDVNKQSKPNVMVMFVFSFLNLLVDAVNIMFFSKADHAFGYDTFAEDLNQVVVQSGNDNGNGDGDENGNGNAEANLDNDATQNGRVQHVEGSSPRQTKKQISETYKRMMRERKRRKGGAYSHVIGDDDDDREEEDDDEGEGEQTHDFNDDGDSSAGAAVELTLTRPLDAEHDHSKFSISDEELEDDENDAGVVNGINTFANSTKDDVPVESYRIGNGHGNGHGHGHGSSLSILQNDSIDDEEAARQIALYSMQQGQANLNMVRTFDIGFYITLVLYLASTIPKLTLMCICIRSALRTPMYLLILCEV